jgi:hypothetical protein
MLTRALIISVALLSSAAADAGGVRLTWDHFYDHEEAVEALESLHSAYGGLTDLRTIGTSEEGREIWLLTINNPETGRDVEKPGIYIDGSIHGNEITATEVCLYLAWYLLDSYEDIPMIRELVDSRVFYIVPIVNVDSRARFFTDPSNYNIGRTARVPYDDDRDGLFDEDAADDLDGDGEILQMRIKDPFGGWKTHPDDPRVMVRTKPWEKGEWRRLGDEGIDNDGDGRINEDWPGYLDMNRNYAFKWQPPYVEEGSGDFPMSGRATKAVSDFVLTKPNICFAFAYHNAGGMILRGPGSKLAGMYSPKDVEVYDFLGEEGEKIIPGYRYMVAKDDLYATHGDFDEWMYSNMGVYAFAGELFTSSQERYREPEKLAERDERWFGGTPSEEKHKFDDNVNQGAMFRDWRKYDHPQFGEIEIGGWRKFTTRVPPTFMLHEMLHRNASLVILAGRHAPDIELELIEVKGLGGGLIRIRVRASNPNAIPTLSAIAKRHDLVRDDIFKIEGNGFEVLSGGVLTDLHFDRVQPVEHRPHLIFATVPSFGKTDIQWVVKGTGKAKITFDSVKAMNRSLTVDLQ